MSYIWPDKHVAFLKDNYKHMSNSQIGAALERSASSVKAMRARLRLPTPPTGEHPKRPASAIAAFQATMAARKPERTAAFEAKTGWPRITTKAADVLGPFDFAY